MLPRAVRLSATAVTGGCVYVGSGVTRVDSNSLDALGVASTEPAAEPYRLDRSAVKAPATRVDSLEVAEVGAAEVDSYGLDGAASYRLAEVASYRVGVAS